MFHGHWKNKNEDSDIEVSLLWLFILYFEALHEDMRKLHKKNNN